MDRIHDILNSVKYTISEASKKLKRIVSNHTSTKFSVGDIVQNINPECKHYGSIGNVVAVERLPEDMGNVIAYKTVNSGNNWSVGQTLKKTETQLIKANYDTPYENAVPVQDELYTGDTFSEEQENETPEVELNEYKQEFLNMSISSLKAISQHAKSIVDHLDRPSVKENLTESWLQGKIAITEENMRTIHDFVMFSESDDDTEGTEAAKKKIDHHHNHHNKHKPVTKMPYRILPSLITRVNISNNPSNQQEINKEPSQKPSTPTTDTTPNNQPSTTTDTTPSAPSTPAAPASGKPGLWENIRKKKEREGDDYKPAKRGDEDRPNPEQWKKLTKDNKTKKKK